MFHHLFRASSLLLLLAGMILSGPAVSRVSGQSTAPGASPIDQLSWIVGGTWTTQETASDGSPLLVKMNCRWSNNRKAILYVVSFVSKGKEFPQYDGMFVWHPGKGKLVLWQVNPKGEVAEGELTVNGKEMDQSVHVFHPDGKEHFLKAHYKRLNDDSFRFKAFFRTSESTPWLDALDVVYSRQPLDAPKK
jgi:hypothetical protein